MTELLSPTQIGSESMKFHNEIGETDKLIDIDNNTPILAKMRSF